MLGIISLLIAIFCLTYACYLHVYYQRRTLRSLREVEEEKYREYMWKLGVSRTDALNALKEFWHISDLIAANKKLKKAFKKHKLDH